MAESLSCHNEPPDLLVERAAAAVQALEQSATPDQLAEAQDLYERLQRQGGDLRPRSCWVLWSGGGEEALRWLV